MQLTYKVTVEVEREDGMNVSRELINYELVDTLLQSDGDFSVEAPNGTDSTYNWRVTEVVEA